MFDEAQIQEMLDAAKPAVIESLKRDLQTQISWDVKNEASRIVKETVVTWVNENIVPEIVAELIESKAGLAEVGRKLAPPLVEAMVKTMTEEAIKNLGQSWTRQEIFKKLFG